MGNYKLVFSGAKGSNTENHDLVCYHNVFNNIFIEIDMDGHIPCYIALDKATAIKLHRELKKQISFIEEGGNDE